MSGRAKDLVKSVKKQTGAYWLNYPPGRKIELGDIVVREGGVWRVIGNVKDRGVEFTVNVDDSQAAFPWVTQSESGVKIEFATEVQPGQFKYVVPGEIGAKVSLEGGSKYLLSMKGARVHRINSIEDTFWKSIKSKYSVWSWDLRHRIVTEIVVADSATFLGSGSAKAEYELQGDAKLKAPGAPLAVGSLSADFGLVSTAESAETFASLPGKTPLIGLHKVGLFGGFTGAAEEASIEDQEILPDDTDPDDEDNE